MRIAAGCLVAAGVMLVIAVVVLVFILGMRAMAQARAGDTHDDR